MIGKTLAHYEITGLLGKGGMGEVYRARDTKLSRDVALKLLPPDFAADPDRLHRFEREARLLASLSHPHIATIHGFEQDDGHHFLVLELVEGEELAERVRRGPIPTREALVIAHQIAEGMEAAHEKGIIHRDLKPANVKQAADGKIKILDFGLARADEVVTPEELEHSPTISFDRTRDGMLLGTAPYMSPEQLKGHPVDARSDIWAFGCVLYEMLTSISPFSAQSSAEIMARTLEHQPDHEKLPKDLPPSVARLVRRCLAKDPHDRLHSMADIRILLQDAMEAGPEAATLETPRRSFSKRLLALGAVAAFALGALAVGLIQPRSDPVETTRRDPVRLMIPVRDETAVVPLPECSSVAISPDGKFVVYAASNLGKIQQLGRDDFANTGLYRRPIDSFEATFIEGTVGGSAPFFSPDGRWVGFFHIDEGMLKKVSRDGGIPENICFLKEMTFRGAYWTEDGTILFSGGQGISIVNENGGDRRDLKAPDRSSGEKTLRFPDLIPGTRQVLFMRGTSEILSYDEGEIALLDRDSGDVRILSRGGLDPRYVPSGHIVFGRAGKIFAMPFDLEQLEVTGSPVEVLDGVVTSDGYGSMQMDFSRDGTMVYVAGGPEQFATELMILSRDGTAESLPQPARPYGNVELSPDANRIVVSVLGANASVWIYELGRGTMSKLVSGWDNFSPVWSPRGDEVVFGSSRGSIAGLWITTTDGSGTLTSVREFDSNAYPSSWSSKDDRLAVSNLSPDTGLDIWLFDRNGEGTPVIQTQAREVRARFSPDGNFLAYTSDESGQLEVYVRSLTANGRQWKLSEDGGDMPVWSREGDAIFFWNEQRLMTVRVDLEPDFKPSRASEVLEASVEVHDFDVFPGGQEFVIIGRRPTHEGKSASISRGRAHARLFPARTPDIHVVLNWFEELERLAPHR